MVLSKTQRDIIRCVLHRGALSAEKLSALVPYKPHVIRRCLAQLIEEQVIRKTIFCNVYRLGFTPNNLHFSLASKEIKAKRRILEFISHHPRVSWCAELTGELNYELTFLARSCRDFSLFVDELSDKFGDVFEEKSLGIELSHNYFGYKFLSDLAVAIPVISFEESESHHLLDAVDADLLRALSEQGGAPLSQIADKLKISTNTLQYRKERLKKNGVLLEEVFFLNRNNIQTTMLNASVSVSRGDKRFREALMRFSATHPNILCCHRCVGAWDYKIAIVGDSRDEVHAAVDVLANQFGSNISNVRTAILMKDLKDDFFPFSRRSLGLA